MKISNIFSCPTLFYWLAKNLETTNTTQQIAKICASLCLSFILLVPFFHYNLGLGGSLFPSLQLPVPTNDLKIRNVFLSKKCGEEWPSKPREFRPQPPLQMRHWSSFLQPKVAIFVTSKRKRIMPILKSSAYQSFRSGSDQSIWSKGGLISEDIFNLVQTKWTKSVLILNFSI